MSSDLELLQSIAARDSAAFAVYFDRHAPRVLGFLVKLLSNRTDADDVLQDVFWQVWKTADRYDATRSSPQVWLFLMARSRSIDLMRKRKIKTLAEFDGHSIASEPLNDEIEVLETSAHVKSALAQLPDEQSSVIRLAFYSGLTHPEIAERLQIPLGTAKTRIRSGMTRLRSILGESRQTCTAAEANS